MFDFGIPEPAETMTTEIGFTDEALKFADQITLRDLLEAPNIDQNTIDNLMRCLHFSSKNLFHATNKTDHEKILLTDLNDLLRCAKDQVDSAFPHSNREAA